jgi:hypothetical protein
MRARRTPHILLIALTMAIWLLPSASVLVSAGHCGELEQRVATLDAEAQELERDLRDAEIDLDRKQRILENFLDAWTDDAEFLAEGTLADEAMLETVNALGQSFTVDLVPVILISLAAPEFLSITSVYIVNFLNTAYTMGDMAIKVQQMTLIIDELIALTEGSPTAFAEGRQFAQQNNLESLEQLIDLVEHLSDLSGIEQAYDDWFNAGINVESLAGALEVKRAELQAAADALDRCVQEDISPVGLWLVNADRVPEGGKTVQIVIEEGSGVVSALFLTVNDEICPLYGNRRTQYMQGPYAEGEWSGTMWLCSQPGSEELIEECGVSEVFERPFTATFTGETISGTYRSEWFSYVDTPGTCDWVRDPSGDEDVPFSLTRVGYGAPDE